MRRPIAPITAWTCLLLVYLLPAQSMHNFQEAENLGHLASAPHPATDFGQVGHDASDLNRHPAPTNPEHQAEGLYPRPYEPQPNPRIPKKNPLRKQLNPIPHLNKLKQKLLERIVVPEFLQKIYKVMTRGFIHLEKPKGKFVRVPVYATRKRTPKWEEMEKDATEMIEALKHFEDQHYLTQIKHHSKLFKLVKPAFKPPPQALDGALDTPKLELPEKKTIDLILKARNELEKLGGKTTIFRTKHKERQMLLVKSLVILSRRPAYRYYAENAIKALVNNLKLRENPEALPKIMPYIEAAHYLITTPKEPLDSLGNYAQRLLESDQLNPSLKKILEKQNLESWLESFATEGSWEVHQKYERMLESNAEGSERFHEILKWSSDVLHPGNSQRYSPNDVTFALETLYVHSVQKPEGLGGHNPAFIRLLHASDAWRGSFHPDKAVPAAIELTIKSAIEKKATIVTNEQLLGILNEHKKEFSLEEIP